MINWFDMPAEGLSNGGLFEVKELEVTENGTYEQSGEMYNKVTVNVEGGGGSSDFITIYDGSITTTVEQYGTYGEVDTNYKLAGIDPMPSVPIKVTFNGVLYETEFDQVGNFGAPYVDDQLDYSTYPFSGALNFTTLIISTEDAGTYNIKVEIEEYVNVQFVILAE